jgi:type I restriction enzyme S subunit
MGKRVPKMRFPEFSGEWEEKKLGEVCTKIGDGLHGTPKYSENGVFYFINGNNLRNGNIITDNALTVDKTQFEKNKKDLNGSTILFSINGTIGNIALYNEEPIVLGKSAAYLNVCSASKKFIYFYLQTKILLDNFQKKLTGTTIKNLGLDIIRNTKISLPVITEQQKIADFLSTVDNIIASEQRILDDLQLKKKGLMQKLFSRELRFKGKDGKEFPEWEEKRLGEVCKIIGGGTPDTTIPEYWGGTIQWFTPTEVGHSKYVRKSVRTISESGFNKSAARKLPAGTVLLSSRATLGEMSIAKTECTTNQGFQSLIPGKKTTTEYIYYLQPLIKKYCFKYAYGSTFLEISNSNLAKCPIPFPCLEEQQKIAECLELLDNVIEEQHKIIDGWKLRKKGLLQQMFV